MSPPPIHSTPISNPAGIRPARVLALLIGLGCIAWVLHVAPPGVSRIYPPCLLHRLTGLHCPGCGMTRSVYWWLHGDWRLALQNNLLSVVLIPGIVWGLLRFGRPWLRGESIPSPDLRPPVIVGLLLLLASFGIARNLPFPAFRGLAPPAAARTGGPG